MTAPSSACSTSRSIETQLFKVPALKADVTKMSWIGRIISNNAVLFAWHSAAVKTIDDAYTKPLIVCSTGSASQLRWTMLKRLARTEAQSGHRL